jgi:hypothetical protein
LHHVVCRQQAWLLCSTCMDLSLRVVMSHQQVKTAPACHSLPLQHTLSCCLPWLLTLSAPVTCLALRWKLLQQLAAAAGACRPLAVLLALVCCS